MNDKNHVACYDDDGIGDFHGRYQHIGCIIHEDPAAAMIHMRTKPQGFSPMRLIENFQHRPPLTNVSPSDIPGINDGKIAFMFQNVVIKRGVRSAGEQSLKRGAWSASAPRLNDRM